ncbi:metal ABC transporter substrate-binding protein [Acuticoccus kandeliae]|uniref:metal ABC transporter substrate-binding protein n=1 Tax=Acuticoccus kandeliae TaxID=2073160 RepID=UPI00196AF749|nr:metal ABC transporter substrate-binding protein [Acuticoccus kandeliae]
MAATSGLVLILATAGPGSAQDRLAVITSFSILGDMVGQIGGDAVTVSSLVGPNGDAHVYEPTPADARALAGAPLLITNGLDFEAWLPRLVEASGFAGTEIVASQGVTPRRWTEEEGHADEDHDDDHEEAHDAAHEEEHLHGEYDPHAWQDLSNGVIYARNIMDTLVAADPAHADQYRERGAAYIAALEALDAEIRAEIAGLPDDRRTVVTNHEAFGYFGDAYGIRFVAPEGLSTDAEVSAADIARIIQQIRRENIKAVFVENVTDNRLIEQISRETDSTVGGTLYSDSLSKPDGPGATYLDMFRHNATALLSSLKAS